ncbi:LuxR family transcriptional regulator [Streptomyces sp. H10-C2]|uniref:LuxR family transcriptional regulator n=1 Tax=unclassified Streptomyces TaxID=2593676 RepID=UPI0024B9CFBD|nr:MULTISPECIES: LuxR family transcriptional regulator [unclassified Streptomyces]MDJ0346931.1 LuxR family transcriptional regulator [Streptomyces sp. PH10-H1]MDJ0374325.1 LuxR family transcriptional regulator [Streptomyces sp. H10-C2]
MVNEFHTYDDFEQELLVVRALIESTVEKHRERRSRDALVVNVDSGGTAVSYAAERLIGQALRCVDLVLAANLEISQAVYSALDKLLSSGIPGVRARMVCTDATLDREFVSRSLVAAHNIEIRVHRMPPVSAIVVDSRVALLCANSGANQQASIIRAATVIPALRTLFDNVWRHATVASETIDFGDRARADTVRQVLACLRTGVTDETAARELLVSVRTYRRYVAEILTLLNAESRFQAGVRAAELGLLDRAR